MAANWATVARVRLSERIRVVVLYREIDQDILPDHLIEVTGPKAFTDEMTTLARLGRLLWRLKLKETKAP